MKKFFCGKKLQSVRLLNGLSIDRLAVKVGISSELLRQYELGYTTPEFSVINSLKRVFSVKANFFFEKEFVRNVSKIENISFSLNCGEERNNAKAELVFVDFVDYFINKLEKNLIIPDNLVFSLMQETLALYYMSNKIENIAEYARQKLNLKDNHRLLACLELAGAYVLERRMRVDSYSLWTKERKAYIVLNYKTKSAVRKNFDLAHELGHLLLHYNIDMDSLTEKEYRNIEKEANDFACCFLLQKKIFLEDMAQIKNKSSPSSYFDMKIKYKVSIMTLANKAYKLGLLTLKDNYHLHTFFAQMGYRKKEPLDELIYMMPPMRLSSLWDKIFCDKIFTLDDILNKYAIEQEFLTKLFCFDEQFFVKYSPNLLKGKILSLELINENFDTGQE